MMVNDEQQLSIFQKDEQMYDVSKLFFNASLNDVPQDTNED